MSFAHHLRDRRYFSARSGVAIGGAVVPLLLGLLALLVATNAGAACFPGTPTELYVGNTANDAGCTQNTIQAAIDAATCTYGTNIHITHELTYPSQHLTITNKKVTLIGSKSDDICGPPGICDPTNGCVQPPPGPRNSIGGHNGEPIVAITGTSTVAIQYLDIVGATQAPAGNGGGIAFSGSGSLTIDNSTIRGNQAASGGGIYFNGTGSTPSELKVLAENHVQTNVATSGDGGGILIKGNALLTVAGPRTEISANSAVNGQGGGIDVIGPATANISSPDFDGGTSLIHNNFASYGGGIAIKGSDSGSAIALVFTTDPSSPVGIRENTATHTGGGVYVDSQTGSSFAYLRAWDYRIEGNTAVEGAAIYADVEGNNGAAVWLGNLSGNVVLFPTNLGAVPCNNPSLCNTINGNTTSNPDSGSIILIQDHGSLLANRFFMRDNIADHAIRIVGDNVNVVLFNGLLAGNTLQHELIYESGNITPTFINSCTFANDVINAAHVIHTESDLTLTDTIISEPGTLTLDYSGNPDNLVVNYVLSNDISTLPGNGTGVALGAPTFVDLAGGDFHLKADSLGIDFAPTSGDGYYVVHNLIDLDGKPRNVDLPSAGSAFGTQDLGAYELQNLFRECGTSDSIFCDGYDHP